jgi:uncharacterized coiled-coil protein SlyX
MNTNQVLIFGVGRSGTTAIYTLLQEILLNNYPDDIDFVYEPFFWDRQTFNKRYSDYKNDFTKTQSLSLDGIIADRTTDLFIGAEPDKQSIEHEYLQSIVASSSKKNVITKFIRANGRISLFRKIAPKAKILFVIRNPLDVVNSAVNMFDFFGDDFLPSDLKRFKTEVKRTPMYSKEITFGSREENTFAYWYYMNRHFVNYYKSNPQNIMPIVYEDYISKKESSIRAICDFLDIKYKDSYVEVSNTKVGRISTNLNLTKVGCEYLKSKMGLYAELTSELGFNLKISEFIDKYSRMSFNVNKNDSYCAKNTLFLKSVINNLATLDKNKQNEIKKLEHKVSDQQNEIKKLEHKVSDQQNEIKKLEHKVSDQQNEIKKLEHKNELKSTLLFELEKTISINPVIYPIKKIMSYRKLVSKFKTYNNS